MRLHVESEGSGRPLVLLHGWGMHGGVWDHVARQLAPHFRVHCVDLPGHGQSAALEHSEGVDALDAIAGGLSGHFDEEVAVCGWSLGGQIALRWAALAPQQVERLVLVASTPCFVSRHDWPFGIGADILQQFAADLMLDYKATLRRFLALQLRGGEHERELLQALRERLLGHGEPDLNSLRAGLEILRDTDMRAALPAIRPPALVIAGARDRLTPPAASGYLAATLPAARLVEIAGAAHVPFLSHEQIFVAHLTDFLHG
jgi:pimeloyl-[acyl-carrier protein] methyl ester esterase